MNTRPPDTRGHALAHAGFAASTRVIVHGLEIEFTVYRANRWTQRLRGLLGRDELAADEALLLEPCASVHTFGMTRPIDVVFLDAPLDEGARVVGCRHALGTARLAWESRARATLELRAGGAARWGLVRGARLGAQWPSSSFALAAVE